MQIVATFDTSAASAPADFRAAVQAACDFFDRTFSNNVTVNVTFAWSNLGITGSVAQNTAYGFDETYSSTRNALAAHAAQTPGLSSLYLPTANPFVGNSGQLFVTTAEAKVLGLESYTGTDGICTLNSALSYNFDPSVAAVPGKYGAVTSIEHEISEILGRECGSDGSLDPSPEALLRYSNGVIDTSSSYANAYLSLDGGKTNAGPGSVGEQGSDLADYGSDVSGDAFGYTTAGAPSWVSAADLKLMTALGWTLTSAAPPPAPTPPATTPAPDAPVPPLVAPLHANDLNYSLSASGPNHFIDDFNFEASFPDLIHAFGTNQATMDTWYKTYEPQENRVETFNGLDYVASHTDLINAFKDAGSEKAVQDAGAQHFITYGLAEGRPTTFNGLDYIASYGDLIKAFGADNDAGAFHFIETGHSEGRVASFDGLDYVASYTDLINAFGANEQAGAAHFIHFGLNEGRSTAFDGLAYIANYTDLMTALGANNDAGATHYIQFGHNEGRTTSFNVAAYEAAHPDLHGLYATGDQFLAAYIDHYHHTGNLLT